MNPSAVFAITRDSIYWRQGRQRFRSLIRETPSLVPPVGSARDKVVQVIANPPEGDYMANAEEWSIPHPLNAPSWYSHQRATDMILSSLEDWIYANVLPYGEAITEINRDYVAVYRHIDTVDGFYIGYLGDEGIVSRLRKGAEIDTVVGNVYNAISATINFIHERGSVSYVSGTSLVGSTRGRIRTLSGRSYVAFAWKSAFIDEVYGDAIVGDLGDSAYIGRLTDRASVTGMYGNGGIGTVNKQATVRFMYGSSNINVVTDRGVVISMNDMSFISVVAGKAAVLGVNEQATIDRVYGEAIVRDYTPGRNAVKHQGNRAFVYRPPRGEGK